jgi:hypothetical protein
MLAEKGTELADPLVIGREVSPGRGCRSAGMRGSRLRNSQSAYCR